MAIAWATRVWRAKRRREVGLRAGRERFHKCGSNRVTSGTGQLRRCKEYLRGGMAVARQAKGRVEEEEEEAELWEVHEDGLELEGDEEGGLYTADLVEDQERLRVPWRTTSTAVLGKERTEEGARRKQEALAAIAEAAQRGDEGEVWRHLQAMDDDGIRSGPEGWHGLVVAMCKRGEMDSAIEACWRAHHDGEQLLLETYAALERAFVASGDLEMAREAASASELAGNSQLDSWLPLCASLLRAGGEALEEGIALYDSLKPDRLVPVVAGRLAERGEVDRALAKEEGSGAEQREQIRTVILGGLSRRATEGREKEGERIGERALELAEGLPESASQEEPFARALDAYANAGAGWEIDPGEWERAVERINGELRRRGVPQGRLVCAKLAEGYARAGKADEAADAICGGEAAGSVSKATLGVIAQGLSGTGEGDRLLALVEAVARAGSGLPARVKAAGMGARGLATRWLDADPLGSQLASSSSELRSVVEKPAPDDEAEMTRVKPTKVVELLTGASTLRSGELKDELRALGIDPPRLKKECYDRVKQLRGMAKEGTLSADMYEKYAKLAGVSLAWHEEGEEAQEPSLEEVLADEVPVDLRAAAKDHLDLVLGLMDTLSELDAPTTGADVETAMDLAKLAGDADAASSILDRWGSVLTQDEFNRLSKVVSSLESWEEHEGGSK